MSAFQPGDVIGGRYRLVRIMGSGASGVVWSARNESTERDFAIKLMLPEAARDPQRLQRFFKEAKLAGRLRHRCIVEVYDLGKIDAGPLEGAPYLVMELLDGEPLDGLLHRVGKLPAGTALRIMRDVARGLEVAHREGVIHRDLKPANVFLHRTIEGITVPKILDFGISKLLLGGAAHESFDPQETSHGTILGSPAYMSPEQTSGEDLDARADIWSLGVLLYKALAGALPFSAPNFTTLMLAINTSAPIPIEERVPGVPPVVIELVHKCLSRRRGDRYPSAAALADAIDTILDQHELPVLELSMVIGAAVPIPSEHMRTVQLREVPPRNELHTTTDTRPIDITRPSEATRQEASRTVESQAPNHEHDTPLVVPVHERTTNPLVEPATLPLVDEPRAVTADVTDAHPTALSTTEPAREAVSRKRLIGLVALVAALAGVGLLVRGPSSTPPPVLPTTAAAAPPSAVAQPTIVAPSIPASASIKAPEPAPVASTSVKSVVKVAAPKAATTQPPPKTKPAPHEGLVRPGF